MHFNCRLYPGFLPCVFCSKRCPSSVWRARLPPLKEAVDDGFWFRADGLGFLISGLRLGVFVGSLG